MLRHAVALPRRRSSVSSPFKPLSPRLTARRAVVVIFILLFLIAIASSWRAPRPRSDSKRLFSPHAVPVARGWSPISPKLRLQIDELLELEYKNTVAAGEPFTLVFTCSHTDIELHCPAAYRVLVSGPSLHSPSYSSSSTALDERRISVTMAIRDPGLYRIYAWPEHNECDQWNDAQVQYHKLAINGTPHLLRVTGEPSKEGLEACESIEAMLDGRWISKAHVDRRNLLPTSPHFGWLHGHFLSESRIEDSHPYAFAFIPYSCKIPHHSYRDWVELVKPKRLLVMGDSVLRDLFCLMIYPDLGAPAGERQCLFSHVDIQGYHTSHKNISRFPLLSGGYSDINFCWLPEGNTRALEDYLTVPEHIPTHVFFNIALWLAKNPPETYVAKITPILDTLARLLPPSTKILARTSAGMVENIQCYDRIGQRPELEGNNRALLELLKKYPNIVPLDVYPLFNARPDGTSDGRHWSGLGAKWMDRPETGAVELYLADIMFSAWLLGPAQPQAGPV